MPYETRVVPIQPCRRLFLPVGAEIAPHHSWRQELIATTQQNNARDPNAPSAHVAA